MSIELLTARERECLALVAGHLRSKQIGRKLGISPNTVNKHCENAARKLNATSRTEAAVRFLALSGGVSLSPYEPFGLGADGADALDGVVAETQSYERSTPANPVLGRDGNPSHHYSQHVSKAGHGYPSHDGSAEAGALPNAPGDNGRDHGHRSGHDGRVFRPAPANVLDVGKLLLIVMIAAISVLVVTGLVGAERFAFALQDLRYIPSSQTPSTDQ